MGLESQSKSPSPREKSRLPLVRWLLLLLLATPFLSCKAKEEVQTGREEIRRVMTSVCRQAGFGLPNEESVRFVRSVLGGGEHCQLGEFFDTGERVISLLRDCSDSSEKPLWKGAVSVSRINGGITISPTAEVHEIPEPGYPGFCQL